LQHGEGEGGGGVHSSSFVVVVVAEGVEEGDGRKAVGRVEGLEGVNACVDGGAGKGLGVVGQGEAWKSTRGGSSASHRTSGTVDRDIGTGGGGSGTTTPSEASR